PPPPPASPPAARADRREAPPSRTSSSGGASVLPWIVTGAGVLSAAGGGILVASIAWDHDCSPSCSDDQMTSFRTRLDVGYPLLAVGGAAIVTGIVIALVARGRSPSARRSSSRVSF